MSNYRIFVEKKKPYRVEAESLRRELNSNLGLDIKELRLFSVYDLFDATEEIKEMSKYRGDAGAGAPFAGRGVSARTV